MIFGWPYETTLALGRLVFSGVMEKYPSLKIIDLHYAGMVPFLPARIAVEPFADDAIIKAIGRMNITDKEKAEIFSDRAGRLLRLA